MACGCRPRPPDVKTSVANTLGTWKHTIVFAYKAIRYGRRSELPERRSAGYRTWKDRRRTGLKTSRYRASGDAAGRPIPDRLGQPSYPDFPIEERKRGPARRIQQTRSGKELRTESVSNPFPDHIPTRSTRLHSSGAVSSHFPSRLRSFPRASRGLPRVPTDDYGRSRSSDGRCVRPAGSSM